MHAMSEHTFLASWNYVQFKKCRNNLLGDILIVNDFGQNYLCLHQNEPQGIQWEDKQVTLHPTVVLMILDKTICVYIKMNPKVYSGKTSR